MSETAAVPLSVVIPEELNEHLGLLFPLGLDAFLDPYWHRRGSRP